MDSARRNHRVALALGIVCALVGCQPQGGRDSPARNKVADAATTAVTISATDYAFHTPDTLASGWTTFRLMNNGAQPHMAQLIRLDSGMTVRDFLKAYNEAFRTAGPRPEWVRRLGGPGVASPHDTTNATLYLNPGNYVWICLFNVPDGVPHVVGHGMAKPFIVEAASPTRESQIAPQAGTVMRLLDYSFSTSAPLTSGRQMIHVENAGSESHEVGVVKLASGKTIEDFKAWMQKPNAPLESVGRTLGGVTSLAPGAQAYFEVDLIPGEYVLLCAVTARDGRSHIEHGMIQKISISG